MLFIFTTSFDRRLSESPPRSPRHLYLHFPYCASRCPYCDFFTETPSRHPPASAYAEALLRDLSRHQTSWDTVYFGGGTPSEFPLTELERILQAVAEKIHSKTEWTVEVNPGTFTFDTARLLRQYGVNRLSIGFQSTQDSILKFLGRRHTAADNRKAIRLARHFEFPSLSGDLIYAVRSEEIEKSLGEFLSWNLDHISTYELTIEGSSIWARKCFDPSDEEERALEKMNLIEKTLAIAGYHHYEVSNFSRPGHECRHNINVWKCGEYVGIGAGAAGYEGGRRYRNIASVKEFISRGPLPSYDMGDSLAAETISLVLRLVHGISWSDIPFRNRQALEEKRSLLEEIAAEGYITLDETRLAPTRRGILFLNEIVLRFL